jgi:hypothetical protein
MGVKIEVVVAVALLAAVPSWSASAAARWTRSPDGEWVYVDTDHGQWQRAPTGPDNWHWVTPGDDWRRDPNGRWRVIPTE